MMWYVASLAPANTKNRQSLVHGHGVDWSHVMNHSHAVTALTKSHSASKLLGTPTCWRCSSRQSFNRVMKFVSTSRGTPSDSVPGRHNWRDICRAMRASACAAL